MRVQGLDDLFALGADESWQLLRRLAEPVCRFGQLGGVGQQRFYLRHFRRLDGQQLGFPTDQGRHVPGQEHAAFREQAGIGQFAGGGIESRQWVDGEQVEDTTGYPGLGTAVHSVRLRTRSPASRDRGASARPDVDRARIGWRYAIP